jgi:hypothetical protein
MGCCESRNKIPGKVTTKSNSTCVPYNSIPPVTKPEINPKSKPTVPHTKSSPVYSPNWYTMEIIKKLNNCKDSIVHLVDNEIVRKQYPSTRDGKGQFINEIMTYKHLTTCAFVLPLLHVDRENLTFYIPFMSVHPPKNSQTTKIIKDYCSTLKTNFGLERIEPISWSNVVASNQNRMYLIDFGGVPFQYYPLGKKKKWKIQ